MEGGDDLLFNGGYRLIAPAETGCVRSHALRLAQPAGLGRRRRGLSARVRVPFAREL
jgi:hypothetical protein